MDHLLPTKTSETFTQDDSRQRRTDQNPLPGQRRRFCRLRRERAGSEGLERGQIRAAGASRKRLEGLYDTQVSRPILTLAALAALITIPVYP